MSQNIAVFGTSISLLTSILSLENCQISVFELEKSNLSNLESDSNNFKNEKIEINKLQTNEKINQDFGVLTYNLLNIQAKNLPNIKFIDQEIDLIEIENPNQITNQTNFQNSEKESENKDLEEIKNTEFKIQNEQILEEKNYEQNSNQNSNSEQTFEKSFETLKTDNLVIKNLNSGHFKFAWLNYTPKVSQYLAQDWENLEDLEIDLNKKLVENETKKRIDLAILDKENGDFIGICGIWIDNLANEKENISDNSNIVENLENQELKTETNSKTQIYKKIHKTLKMDFWFKEKVWNQGYGQEMASVVYKWLTKNIEFEKLILIIEKNNTFAQKIATNIGGITRKFKPELNFVKNEKLLNFVEYVVENKTAIKSQNITNLSPEITKKIVLNLENDLEDNLAVDLENNLQKNLEIEKNKTNGKNKTKKIIYCITIKNITQNQKLHFETIITSPEIWQKLESKFGKNLQELNLKLINAATNSSKEHKLEEDCPEIEKGENLELAKNTQTTKPQTIKIIEKIAELNQDLVQMLAQNRIFLTNLEKQETSQKNENQENQNSTKKTLEQIQIGLEIAQKCES